MSPSSKSKRMGKSMGKSMVRKMKGGIGGASGYGQYLWGSGDQQHGGAEDNAILPVNDPSGYKGGNGSKIAGGDLATMAVPAVLIAANQLYKTGSNIESISSKTKGKSKSIFSGGKRKSKKNNRGGAILTEIAVPAVLIAANHFYKRSAKRSTQKNKRVSFRRKYMK